MLDGSFYSYAHLEAEKFSANTYRYGEKPTLFFRCEKPGLSVAIAWHVYLGGGLKTTSGRFDTGPVLDFMTTLSTDKTSTFFGHRNGAISSPGYGVNPKKYFGVKNRKSTNRHILRKLLESEQFVVRTKDFRGTEYTAVFELDGIAEGAAQVIKDCTVI